MAIYPVLVNLDQVFEKQIGRKVIINDLNKFDDESQKDLANIMMVNYSQDGISMTPSCDCGEIRGSVYLGQSCKKCGSEVKEPVHGDMAYLLWARAPEGVLSFINPTIMAILLNRFGGLTESKFSWLKWAMFPKYSPAVQANSKIGLVVEKVEAFLEERGVSRGYNSFITNFDIFIEAFLLGERLKKTRVANDTLLEMLEQNKEVIFPRYMAFPNKALMIQESSEFGKHTDSRVIGFSDIINSLTGIDVIPRNLVQKEHRTATAVIDMARNNVAYFKDFVLHKYGLSRQHVLSGRAHFTSRAVVTSITEPHDYDELHMPWSVCVSLLRQHILSKLIHRGWAMQKADEFTHECSMTYHPLMEEIFKELLEEGSYKGMYGIPVLFNRNPSLLKGSIQRHRITKIKTDVRDQTIGLSILVIRMYNADFDGDEMNNGLIPDLQMLVDTESFQQHRSFLLFRGENVLEDIASFPDPVATTISRWFAREE